MEANKTEYFDNAMKELSICLDILGLHPSRSYTGLKRFRVYFIRLIGIITFPLQIYTIVKEFSDGHHFDGLKFIAFTCTVTTLYIKVYTLMNYKSNLGFLVECIENDLKAATTLEPVERAIVAKYLRYSENIVTLWKYIVLGNLVVFAGLSILFTAWSAVSDEVFSPRYALGYRFPFIENNSVEFTPVIMLFEYVIMFYMLLIFIGFEPLAPVLAMHACGQLGLVKYRMSLLLDGKLDQHEVKQRLNKIIIQTQAMCTFSLLVVYVSDIIRLSHPVFRYRFTEEIHRSFLMIYEVILKYATALCPLSFFLFVLYLRRGEFLLDWLTYGMSCLLHVLVPAYCGDILVEVSMSLVSTAYSCGWERVMLPQVRSSLLLVMLRFRRPLALRTAFQLINMEAFSDMCRQCWNIFNLLIAMTE